MRRWLQSNCAQATSLPGASWVNVRWVAVAAAATASASHYSRLGLDAAAAASLTEQDVKAAYRRSVLTCHPDLVVDREKRAAEAEFRRVSEAYSIVMEAVKSRPVLADPKPARAPSPLKKPTVATKERPKTGRPSTGTSQTRSSAKNQQQPKPAFLRRDADKAFVDAFDGKTVAEILFRARYAKQHGGDSRDRQEPTPHADVISRVMDQAIRKQCEAVQRRYGREAVQHARLHVYRPAQVPPKGSHIPFVPFHGFKLPEGVTAEAIPAPAGPVSHVQDEQVTSAMGNIVPRELSQIEKELRDPQQRSAALNAMAKDHGMRFNEGQLFSYHRPY